MPDACDAATGVSEGETGTRERPHRPRGVEGTIWVLEHAQDLLAVVVGVVLVLLAGTLIVSALAGFVAAAATSSVAVAAPALLDQVLLVLILVEIVHTVVLSLRSHRLSAQPFIVIGLVAVIRRILFVLSSQVRADTGELWLLIAMVAAFVAGLVAVRQFGYRPE